MLWHSWVAGAVWSREDVSTPELQFPAADLVTQVGESRCSRHFVKKPAASLAPTCWLLAAQPLGFAAADAPLGGAAPSWTIWRMSVWICIQTQSLQDEARSWSDLLAQPAIFVFFWLCFIYFFTLCSITAGSLSSCPLVFSLSAKCQLSLPAG